MEFKQGKITPTTKREASVFTEFLQLQAAAFGTHAPEKTRAQQNVELSSDDSYRLFCGIERALKTSQQITQRQQKVAEVVLAGLAQARLDEIQTEIRELTLTSERPTAGVAIHDVCNLAAQAVHPYNYRSGENN